MSSTEAAGEAPDPLSQVFDLVVMGTGLGECMLAAAASRAGLKVLHTDAFEYYGGESASFELKQLPDVASAHSLANAVEHAASRSQDGASILSPASKAESLDGAASHEQWPIRYHGVCQVPEALRPKQRRITLDLLPALTMCRGRAIDALVDSGVAAYLDFVVLQACFSVWSSPVTRGSGAGGCSWGVHKLPCTKSDVFEDSSLSFTQKRALMKLLQFALDLRAAEEAERAAREEEEGLAAAAGGAGNSSSAADGAGAAFGGGFSPEEVDGTDAAASTSAAASAASAAAPAGATVGAVESLNERQLGTGRSLLRPQNKQTPSLPFDEYRAKPFASFLEKVGLPPHLQSMMMHAVALLESAQQAPAAAPSSVAPASAPVAGGAGSASHAGVPASNRGPSDTAAGMSRLVRYLGAMGRYGETAFILPQYGSGEVAQAFSRACAVHGGIYMLRTRVDSISLADASSAAPKQKHAGKADADAAAAAEKAPPAAAPAAEAADAVAAAAGGSASPAAACKAAKDSVLLLRTSEGQEIRCRNLAGTAAFLPHSIYRALPASAATVGAATAVVSLPLGPADFELAFPSASLSGAAGDAGEAALSDAELPFPISAPKDRMRFFLVIPPHTAPLGNPCAVYVLQQGAGNAMTPDDSMAVLNVWTQVETAGSSSIGCGSSGSSGSHGSREAAIAVAQRVLAALFGSSEPEPEPTPPAPAPASAEAAVGAPSSTGEAAKATGAGATAGVSDAATAATSAVAAAVSTAAASEALAAAAAAAEPPPAAERHRRCKLLFRQLLSYQSKDTSPAAMRASGAPEWLLRRLHVLSGRAAQSCRVSSEFDAEEARRVFAAVAPGKRFLGPVVTPQLEHDADAAGADDATEASESSGGAAAGSAAHAARAAEAPAEAEASSSSAGAPAAAPSSGSSGAEPAAASAEVPPAASSTAAVEDDLGGLDLDSALALLKDDLD